MFIQSKIFLFRILSVGAVIGFYVVAALCNGVIRRKGGANSGNKFILLYLFFVVGVLVWSLTPETTQLITLFTNPLAFLGFFIAIVALSIEDNSITVLMKIAKVSNTIFPLIVLLDLYLFRGEKAVLINEACYLILFEFLFINEQKPIRKIYLILLMLSIIFISNFFVDRAITIRFAGIFVLYYLFYIFKFLRTKIFKISVLAVTTAALTIVTLYFEKVFIHVTSLIKSNSVNTVDTRTFIFNEFFSKFKGTDWIAGRGYLGTYFSPYFYHNNAEGGDQPIRFSAEIGIVDILLKGGLILLVPFLFIIIKALIDGFLNKEFKSMGFRLSIFLLMEFFLLSIDNFAAFSTHYMFIWLAIGVIYNEKKNNTVFVVEKTKG
ncbi:hypothetical protein DYU05_09250 [Mucilaginibacter terrenus]|uniref:O-antigen ligase domain-containing protein n=1 Tax=Mucilaginibacter terrenus TaxID=2482727 RepID=A0A3E2NXP9_9SPHI|nr:hypothetical protein [Mucilaginibacter terrenus]RFZ85762.1 hypothetical protein DYU05_09250 [Mucilaginibacter terrenus]